MEYRRLGRTGEKVSTIGMGTWRIGVYDSPEEKRQQVNALRRGVELGINLIDTAEMYANGRSEEIVGEAVKDIRKQVFIATKVSPENLHHDSLLSSCKGSLHRLGTSYIDLYQVHWPNSRILIQETMDAMEELVREGKVRYIGVSNFSVAQTNAAREALSSNELASNQVEYSLANRSVEADILPYCEKEKISLIAYTPLARGRVPSSMFPAGLAVKYNMTPAQLMLNWVTQSEAVLAIPKAARIDHMEENASSLSVRFTESEYHAFNAGRNQTI
ncbi:MAG: aldo/keto reductase [Thaumarchaeota archaeon]|nr:aldo/keto reductase [Nitrososphaerota archaeon]